jgi:uroporphyrinogen decarboxylase
MSVWRGLFQSLCVEDWRTLRRTLFALADVPTVMVRTMGTLTDCAAQTIEYALTGVALDFAVFDETIAGAYGSVVSPSYFRRFCAPFYRRLIDILRMRGVRWFIVRTYGNPLVLIPNWIDCGINVLWCSESTYTGVDYVKLRNEYGRQLRFIGGVDLRAIAEGNPAIDRAINGGVAELLSDGGYLPMADGRIRNDVSWQNYRYYRENLERLVLSLAGERRPA